jgi:hypothetical protein
VTLSGRYGDTTGRPYLAGRIHLPRFGIVADLSFIVDTGADRTHLMPGDGERMGLDYRLLIPSDVPVTGVGGPSLAYTEAAILVFADTRNLYVYDIAVTIAGFAPGMRAVPSLLGRDVLDCWHMTYRPMQRTLQFIVKDADIVLRIDDGYPPIQPGALHD